MVKEGGEWKIDGMGFPKFDNSIQLDKKRDIFFDEKLKG